MDAPSPTPRPHQGRLTEHPFTVSINASNPKHPEFAYPTTEEHHDADSSKTIWEQVKEKNESGQYNFERFESMQLLNLCFLQDDIRKLALEVYALADRSSEFQAAEVRKQVERLRPLLKEYNESLVAVHEIMSYPRVPYKSMMQKGPWDKRTTTDKVPLLMADLRGQLEPDGVRKVVERLIPHAFKYSDFFSIGPRRELHRSTDVPEYRRVRAEELEKEGLTRLVDYLARFFVAFFGGASLLVPMIIMIRTNSQDANLIITSTFVLFFALVLSVGSKASNQEILAATAGYAAVLVVFIGTSGAGS